MPFRDAPRVDFFDQPQFRWPAAKVGFELDDLFGELHERFNTAPIFIQDAAAFHHDVAEIAHSAQSKDDFLARLQERRDQRLAEAKDIFDKISTFLFSGYRKADFHGHISPFLQLSRKMSLDCLLAFCASFLGPDQDGMEPSIDLFFPSWLHHLNKSLPNAKPDAPSSSPDTQPIPPSYKRTRREASSMPESQRSETPKDLLPDTTPSSFDDAPEQSDSQPPFAQYDDNLPDTQNSWFYDSPAPAQHYPTIDPARSPDSPSTETSVTVANPLTPQSDHGSANSTSPSTKRKRDGDLGDDDEHKRHKRTCAGNQNSDVAEVSRDREPEGTKGASVVRFASEEQVPSEQAVEPTTQVLQSEAQHTSINPGFGSEKGPEALHSLDANRQLEMPAEGNTATVESLTTDNFGT